ncbi:MAG: hypothetical protein LBP78_00275 [Acidaminococcales bacterium]|jgi:hypothetical protein|nr:hypothetical protein [Acidaminococcales bacterium]
MADNNTTGINAAASTSSSMERGHSNSGGVYSSGRGRVRSVLTPEEIQRINNESARLGKKGGFSPAAIVDISSNAKKLWQDDLNRRGGTLNIAKPYFSSRLLDKMRQAGQLGPGGLASLAYKRMIDIFI